MNSDKKINGLKNTSLLIVLGLLAFSFFMASDSFSQEAATVSKAAVIISD